MNSVRIIPLLNICLRFGTLGTRFVFVFFLAKYMSAESVGYYGIFTASIGYAIFFVGAEFYVYVTRQILGVEKQQRGRMLKGHAALSAMLYLACFPVILVLIYMADWPGSLFFWFLPILFLEHFNQEIFRLLVVMQQQLMASSLLFVRQGSWAIITVVAMAFSEENRALDFLMLTWFLAGIVAAILGIWKLKRLEIGGWQLAINWSWVRRGLGVAAPFLVATLAVRGILVFDRYWLESLGGIEVVGSYVLFFGVMSALLAFLDAGVFSFVYPELIKHNHDNERMLARAKVKKMFFQTLGFSTVFAIIAWWMMPVILAWVGNPVHESHLGLFPGIMLAMTLYAISQVPHWGLYALGRDKIIILSHIVAFVAFLLVTWVSSKYIGPGAVLLGLVAAFGLILIIKAFSYLRLVRGRV